MNYKGINVTYFVKDTVGGIWFYILKNWIDGEWGKNSINVKCLFIIPYYHVLFYQCLINHHFLNFK